MNRIEYRIVAGFLAAAIGFAPMGSTAAADPMNKTENKTGQVRAKSSLSAEAPLLGRVVITPSPEQLAKIRLERRMIGLDTRAVHGQRAGNRHPGTTGAI